MVSGLGTTISLSELRAATGAAVLAAEAIVPGSMSCIMNPACQERTVNNVQQVADDLENWLGDDLIGIRNEAGDFILTRIEMNAFSCVVDSATLLSDIYTRWESLRVTDKEKAKQYLFDMLPGGGK